MQLRGPLEIRRALGDVYFSLKHDYDFKRRERRRRLKSARTELPRSCAACGRSRNAGLELAHISPLAESASTTLANLLWLCSKPGRGRKPGCHRLFDTGFASIAEMKVWSAKWIDGGTCNGRDVMLERFRDGDRPLQRGSLARELNTLRSKQDELPKRGPQWQEIQIRIAEVTRRRARKDALRRALSEIEVVNVRLIDNPRTTSRYFYEKGYIHLLSGDFERARANFLRGRNAIDDEEDSPSKRWRWTAHTALVCQCERQLSAGGSPSENVRSWGKVRESLMTALNSCTDSIRILQRKLRRTVALESSDDLRHSRRWLQNCYLHLLKAEIALDRKSAAMKLWSTSVSNWEKMNVLTGWDTGFRPTYLHLGAMMSFKVSTGENDLALARLVRCMVLHLGARQQQPEGIRDVLFTMAEALELQGDRRHRIVSRVAQKSVDNSSWFYPYSS